MFNSGAILLDGKFTLVARVEGADRKSFFAVAQSESGVEGFRFWDHPVCLPDTCPEETNVYDMRLTKHEDGLDLRRVHARRAGMQEAATFQPPSRRRGLCAPGI